MERSKAEMGFLFQGATSGQKVIREKLAPQLAGPQAVYILKYSMPECIQCLLVLTT